MSTASVLMHSLGWALIHSLWQGGLIYCLLRGLLLLAPGMNARAKYYCAYFSQMALLVWFSADLWSEWQYLQGITIKVTEGVPDAGGARVFFVKALPEQGGYFAFGIGSQLERFFPLITLAYTAGLFLLSSRFCYNIYQVLLLKKKKVRTAPDSLVKLIERLRMELGISRRIQLLLTEQLQVPAVLGTLKPVILLPVAALSQMSPDQVEAILLHELAHVKRHDYLLNILQTIAETVLFFNPFTWLTSSVIRREREHCCDDIVLSYMQYPLPYAKALAMLEGSRLQADSLAMAASGQSNHLLNRIKRMMETKKQSLSSGHIIAAFVLIVTLAVSVIWLTPALAQKRKDDKDKPLSAAPGNRPKAKTVIVIDEDGNRTEYHDMEALPESVRKTIRESVKTAGLATLSAADALKVADETLKHLDVAGIRDEVSRSLAQVKPEEIREEVDKAMKEVDWDHVNEQIASAMEQVDQQLKDPKMKAELRAELGRARAELARASADASRDLAQAQAEIRNAHRDMEAAREESERAAEDARVDAENARADAENARKEAALAAEEANASDAAVEKQGSRFDDMLRRMQADGLINRKEGFEIRKSKGRLYINDERQPDEVYRRYEPYLGKGNVSIEGDKDNLSISVSR